MSPLVAITGNGAAAEAMRQIDPDVVAAFPITPSTQIMEDFAKFHADGKVATELVTVESEHSAMSACIGAAAAGGRVMTATSSCGLALMWEMLYVAASMRQPVVMTLVNRALSGPINIHCDHADAMGCRDAGWIQIFCREQPGGLRQPDHGPAHRGAPGRPAAGHGLHGRLHHLPLHRDDAPGR